MLILFLLSFTSAATISGEIYPPKNPADRKDWSLSRIKLQVDGKNVSYLDSKGNFEIFNVKDGVHVLEIIDPSFVYKTFILKVQGEFVYAREANNYKGNNVGYPLKIQTERRQVFFEEREGFSIWSILMNPMLMMSLLMIGIAFISPKLKLDPDQMNEMKEMQKQMNTGWMSSFLNPPS